LLGNTKKRAEKEERCIDVIVKDKTYHMKFDVMDESQLKEIDAHTVFIMEGTNMEGTGFKLTVPKKPRDKPQNDGFACDVTFVYHGEPRRYPKRDNTMCL